MIGTHRLLQTGVRWKDLGLVVVDEEQRFGVEHKEHIKSLRTHVDVLTMSATPIPRTLEMSLAGIREMSTILTPPEERYPVLTYVGQHDDKQIAAALRRELLRDGQAFYVHNRVSSIDAAAARVRELVPEAKVAVAHGQMHEDLLETTVEGFWNREFDILVAPGKPIRIRLRRPPVSRDHALTCAAARSSPGQPRQPPGPSGRQPARTRTSERAPRSRP